MLGIGPSARSWCWRAAGKHPAAGDFVDVGQGTPLTDALADWMTRGYLELQRQRRGAPVPCSWRFWMHGGRKGRLICGLIRDSSDRIGRPFPFMIAGEGSWEGWEQRWVEMPALLAGFWRRLERIAAQRYDELHELSIDVSRLGAPEPEQNGSVHAASQEGAADSGVRGSCLHGGGHFIIALGAADPDPTQAALKLHREMACRGEPVPKAGFIGGTAQRAFLALIMQPLGQDVFEMLWGETLSGQPNDNLK